MNAVRRGILGTAAAVVVAAGLGFPSAHAAPVPCQAEAKGEFRRDETYDDYIDKIFLINVTSTADCAKVYFDFITKERLFNGEVITSTRREFRKTTAEPSKASALKFRIARDSELLEWKVQFSQCVVCGTEQ